MAHIIAKRRIPDAEVNDALVQAGSEIENLLSAAVLTERLLGQFERHLDKLLELVPEPTSAAEEAHRESIDTGWMALRIVHRQALAALRQAVDALAGVDQDLKTRRGPARVAQTRRLVAA